MADIIEFKLKAKPKKTTDSNSDEKETFGEIVLFSGVRIERHENLDYDLNQDQNIDPWFLNKKIH